MADISAIKLPNGDIFDLVDEKVTQNASTSNIPQPILFRNNVSAGAGNSTEWVRYASAVTITPSTGTINATKFNDYILAGACAKAVDNSISTSSSSSNLPTSAAVASFVEGKGYITSAAIPALLSGTTSTVTPTQVKNALANNQNVEISHTDTTFGSYKLYDFILSSTENMLCAPLIAQYGGNWLAFELLGDATNNTWSTLTTLLATASDIPTKTSDLTNDSGFITGYTETDPTVPSWAKASTKPTYTATEVGALPNTTVIPSKTSDLTNDSGFITSYTETDPIFTASAAHGISASDITNWNSKQAALVSGTNIKTINSQSLLGSGDITTQTIYASTVAPTSADGIDGDVWFIYTPSA